MRRILILLLLLLLTSGCRLNDKYVKADRLNYKAIAPKLRKLIAKDETLDDEDKEAWYLKLDTWDFRIRRAERYLEIEKKPKDSIWDGWEPW